MLFATVVTFAVLQFFCIVTVANLVNATSGTSAERPLLDKMDALERAESVKKWRWQVAPEFGHFPLSGVIWAKLIGEGDVPKHLVGRANTLIFARRLQMAVFGLFWLEFIALAAHLDFHL